MKEKLKWVCLLLILSNFSFDLISGYLSRKPVASGIILDSSSNELKRTARLKITNGEIHEGGFIRSQDFSGTITKINPSLDSSFTNIILINIEGNQEELVSRSEFQVFSTLRVVNFLLIIELTLIFFIFYLILNDFSLWKKLTLAALILSIVLWIYRNILLDKIHSYGGFYNGGTTILIILFALAFFYYQLKRPENPFIYSTPAFWIISAILLYKAGTFFLFLYTNTLDQNEKENFYTINSAFYILQNILFAISFFIQEKKPVKNYSKRSLQHFK